MRYIDARYDFNTMTEEEIDELYRPRKTNSRKTLAVLYVYKILKEETSSKRHLMQNEILKKLEEKYEIVIERKALGRILNQLADEDLNIVTSLKHGFWFEQDADDAA